MTNHAVAEMPTQRLSIARIAAKTMHAFVVVWSAFCAIGVLLALTSLAALSSVSQAARGLGVTVGLTMWAMFWFVPVVAAELFAIGLSLSSPAAAEGIAAKREWRMAGIIAAIPVIAFVALIVVGALVQRAERAYDVPSITLTGDLHSTVNGPIDLRCPSEGTGPMVARYTPDGHLTITFASHPGVYVAQRAATYCEAVLRAAYKVPEHIDVTAQVSAGGNVQQPISLR
jgi:hypothetical protein